MKTMRKLCGVVAGMLLLCAGCNQAAQAPSPGGQYTLVSVDGNQVPCTITHEGMSMNVKSGSFTINSDGTCASKMTVSATDLPETTIDRQATWTQQGSTLDMQWEGFGKTTGTLENGRFTMTNEGMVLVYQK